MTASGHILSVAEKPSVAKDISRLLSNGQSQSRRGPSTYNPIHSFPLKLHLPGHNGAQQYSMQFTSVLGHLLTLEFSPPYNGPWSSCSPSDLFQCPVQTLVIPGQEPVRDNISQAVRGAYALILWLDCDREGENIASEVASICRQIQPNIIVLRARFSAIIPQEMAKALTSLGPININLSDAVDARQEIDLRIGSAFTRFQTLSWATKFQGMPKVLSYGPCQFPTLGFIVERHLKIQNFVSQNFWNLSLTLSIPAQQGQSAGSANLSWKRGPLYDHTATLVFYSLCVQAGVARVLSVVGSPTSKPAPIPLSTVPLQQAAATHLRIGSELCMKAAEDLYRRGLVSYPRTETDSFVEGTDIAGLVGIHAQSQTYGEYTRRLLQAGFRVPRRGNNNDNAHPPIHPTQAVDLDQIQDPIERKLYDFIVRRFLACCSPDAKGEQTRVAVECGGEEFNGYGLTIKSRGYLDIFPFDKWSNVQLPALNQGQEYPPSMINMTESRTAPPSYLTEAELIGLMDRHGIGTDATIAQHITTVLKREYAIKRPDNHFVPSPLGVALVTAYNSIGLDLSLPKRRALMEVELKRICLGQVRKTEVVQTQLRQMAALFDSIVEQQRAIENALSQSMSTRDPSLEGTLVAELFSTCGRCQQLLQMRTDGVHPRYLSCVSCKLAYKLPRNGNIVVSDPKWICPICSFEVLEVHTENNSVYRICPQCYSNGFTCRACSNANCHLAGGTPSVPVYQCPMCPSAMTLRHAAASLKPYLSCQSCKAIGSLPGPNWGVISSMPDKPCPNCRSGDGQFSMCHIQMVCSGHSPITYRNQTISGCIRCPGDIQDIIYAFNNGDSNGPRIKGSTNNMAAVRQPIHAAPDRPLRGLAVHDARRRPPPAPPANRLSTPASRRIVPAPRQHEQSIPSLGSDHGASAGQLNAHRGSASSRQPPMPNQIPPDARLNPRAMVPPGHRPNSSLGSGQSNGTQNLTRLTSQQRCPPPPPRVQLPSDQTNWAQNQGQSTSQRGSGSNLRPPPPSGFVPERFPESGQTNGVDNHVQSVSQQRHRPPPGAPPSSGSCPSSYPDPSPPNGVRNRVQLLQQQHHGPVPSPTRDFRPPSNTIPSQSIQFPQQSRVLPSPDFFPRSDSRPVQAYAMQRYPQFSPQERPDAPARIAPRPDSRPRQMPSPGQLQEGQQHHPSSQHHHAPSVMATRPLNFHSRAVLGPDQLDVSHLGSSSFQQDHGPRRMPSSISADTRHPVNPIFVGNQAMPRPDLTTRQFTPQSGKAWTPSVLTEGVGPVIDNRCLNCGMSGHKSSQCSQFRNAQNRR